MPQFAIVLLITLTALRLCASPALARTARPPRPSLSVPILMYHYIDQHDDRADPKGIDLYIPPETLDRQLQWLEDHGYEAIDLDQMLSLFQSPMSTVTKPVVLTFDDGYEDAYTHVLPILESHHMRGVFYIVSGFLGRAKYLTTDQVKDLARREMMIAAHTVSHKDLTTLTRKRMRAELGDNRAALEALIGAPVRHLAYPAGKYNAAVISIARKLGYVTAVTTHHGVATDRSGAWTLPRIRMTKQTNMKATFSSLASGPVWPLPSLSARRSSSSVPPSPLSLS